MPKTINGKLSDNSYEYINTLIEDQLVIFNSEEEQINTMYRFNPDMLSSELEKVNVKRRAINELKNILESNEAISKQATKVKVEDIVAPTIEDIKVNKKSKK